MTKKEVGELIKDKRIDLGLTQEDFANEIGVSSKAISKWESGKSLPDTKVLKKVANILSINLDEYIENNESKNIKSYEYTANYLTDTKSFKIRTTIRKILLLILFTLTISIVSIAAFISISFNLKRNNLGDYMSESAYKAIIKENDKVIEKCNIILNNNSSIIDNTNKVHDIYDFYYYDDDADFDVVPNTNSVIIDRYTDEEIIKADIKDLKKYAIEKKKIVNNLWNNRKNPDYAWYTLEFLDKTNNFYFNYHTQIYEILNKYSDNKYKWDYVSDSRTRRASNYIYNHFLEYGYKNIDLQYLTDSRSETHIITNAVLLRIDRNNYLLDNIIEVGKYDK